VPFKAKAACRRHIPKQQHRVTNWAVYDAGLRARGSLTVWFTAEAMEAWKAEPRTGRGGQPRYSSLAITTALTLRAVFRLALRQTEGLISSLLQLLGLNLAVPDHSTLSRRAKTLEVPRPKAGSEPVHLLVDSTGLKLCGASEWLIEKHGTKRRRAWRVLHLATDADTGRIVASVLTDKDADDGSQVGPLLERIDGAVASVTGDGAYDRDDVYAEVAARHPAAAVVVPPRANAAERSRRDRADAARPTSTMHRRARPHGLAAGIGVRLARSRGVRYLALEARPRRWAPFANGRATGERGGHRGQRSEPNAGAGTPGVRPHRITQNTGRAQCAHTADPCNKAARRPSCRPCYRRARESNCRRGSADPRDQRLGRALAAQHLSRPRRRQAKDDGCRAT
jgi:Transposase DDE domain